MYKNKQTKRNYDKLWCSNRRKKFLKNKKCRKCKTHIKLHLHHKNPLTKGTKVSHNIWTWSEERRKIELKKCVILCQNCHKKIHEATHGTRQRYEYYKCRCKKCKNANSIKMKNYRSHIKQNGD